MYKPAKTGTLDIRARQRNDLWSEGAIKSCNEDTDSKRIRSFLLGQPGFDVDRNGSFGDTPVPPVMEEIVVVVQEEKLIPKERVQQRTVEYVSAPQFRKEAVGVVLAPTARGQHWIGEQIVEWERFFWTSQCPHTGKRASRRCFLVPQEHAKRHSDEFLWTLQLLKL